MRHVDIFSPQLKFKHIANICHDEVRAFFSTSMREAYMSEDRGYIRYGAKETSHFMSTL